MQVKHTSSVVLGPKEVGCIACMTRNGHPVSSLNPKSEIL